MHQTKLWSPENSQPLLRRASAASESSPSCGHRPRRAAARVPRLPGVFTLPGTLLGVRVRKEQEHMKLLKQPEKETVVEARKIEIG